MSRNRNITSGTSRLFVAQSAPAILLLIGCLVAGVASFAPSPGQPTAIANGGVSSVSFQRYNEIFGGNEVSANGPKNGPSRMFRTQSVALQQGKKSFDEPSSSSPTPWGMLKRAAPSTLAAMMIGVAAWTSQSPLLTTASSQLAWAATDSSAIVGCLFQKCSLQLGKCIANPKCLANVACINTCTGKPDEIGCQIKCGDLFENDVVGEFNKCAVSDMTCVPKQQDENLYPRATTEQVVPKFDTSFWTGRYYITAGQNELFDVFPCQVHFFTETSKGNFVGKLNWRVTEPDGEFFTRNALQEFVQDPNMPAHLVNDGNEYLHYSDEWWVIDYERDDNPDKVPPFAFVYYRGSNDAWDGYGGVVVYTRDAALPTELIPRLRTAAAKVGFDFDKDFQITDNSCPAELSGTEKRVLREKFAGKVALQTERQLQAAAVRLRGNVVNSSKAQRIFFENRVEQAQKAFSELEDSTEKFEQEAVREVSLQE